MTKTPATVPREHCESSEHPPYELSSFKHLNSLSLSVPEEAEALV